MDAVQELDDVSVSGIASAIGEPARARMLYCLLDGRARTSTELAIIGGVNPSTASAHLNRLLQEHLVRVLTQGKHRYYSLGGRSVARALESLSVLAGFRHGQLKSATPNRLRFARTCYDHIAGTIGVQMHHRLREKGSFRALAAGGSQRASYVLTSDGERLFRSLGIDVDETRNLRRRFAYPCLDWSERQPHIGGALGAALLTLMLNKAWIVRDLDSRVLEVTNAGRRAIRTHFSLELEASSLHA